MRSFLPSGLILCSWTSSLPPAQSFVTKQSKARRLSWIPVPFQNPKCCFFPSLTSLFLQEWLTPATSKSLLPGHSPVLCAFVPGPPPPPDMCVCTGVCACTYTPRPPTHTHTPYRNCFHKASSAQVPPFQGPLPGLIIPDLAGTFFPSPSLFKTFPSYVSEEPHFLVLLTLLTIF